MRNFYKKLVQYKPLAVAFAGLFFGLSLAGCPFGGPTADFSASPTEGDAPLSVRFSDQSLPGSAAIDNWLWDFGDGTESTEEDPVHIYAAHGNYRVTLTVTSIFGTETETKNAYITVKAAPVATFSATPRSGNTPLSVQFSDESDGGPFPITAWHWTFGDGETSDEADPAHTYSQPGAYAVGLTVTSQGGTDTETRQGYIQVGSLPAASFKASPSTGRAPLDVQFTDTTNPGGSPIQTWNWNFGDGEVSTEQNPEHRYENPGAYTVALTVRNIAGENTSTRTNLIHATQGPTAAFRANPVQGAAPLSATFTDESQAGTSPIKSWLWDFGDGTSSTQRNPIHEFATAGQYNISLTVETDAGTDTVSKEKYITALAPPRAGFTAAPVRGPAPLSVEFKDASTPGASAISTRQWSFGDAAVSGEPNPVHVYTTPGRYPVSLTVQSAVGSNTLNRENFIEVVALPVASFEANPTSGESPLSVTFTDTSAPGTQPISTWLWDFGDGTTSADQNPTRVYTGTGEYTVKLTVTTAEGSNTATRTQLVKVFERADANFTADILSGAAPLSVQFHDASDPGSVGITGRVWDFGDGATSTAEDPLHVYTQPGTYTVSLILSTPAGPDSERKASFIRVEPSVSFSRNPGTGVVPLTVAFTNTTATAPLTANAWAWSFGDDGASTVENPSHTYTKAGIYDVTLRVTTEQGEVSTTRTQSVQLRPRPAFSGTPLSATGAPMTVQFQDATDPGNLTISGWDWNFGDGSHSTLQNPAHTFAEPGLYDVSLTVTTELGNSTTVKADYVLLRPAAAFSASPTTGKDSLDVQFTDLTNPGSLEVLTWSWDFGDGATSHLQNPSHHYAGPGTYTVALTTGSTHGSDTETRENLVVITPNVNFVGSVTSGAAPLDVAFSDLTRTGTLETTARSWNFGEGTPGTEEAPLHTYSLPGRYNVTLTITTQQGQATGERKSYIEVLPALVATKVVTPGAGNASVAFTNTTVTGNLTGVTWRWDFGDGTTSPLANPTHNFTEPGIYEVTLALTSAEGVSTTETMATINVLPVISLTATPESGLAPLDVQFANTSNTGRLDVTAVLWDFGDGNTSTDPAPLHTYAAAGTYTATLTVTTALGDTVATVPATIDVAPEPNFSGIPRTGVPPLSVTFSNTSNAGGATITGLDWDFGDGATSTATTPTHTYSTPGDYTVTLAVTTNAGTETSTKTDYIRVKPVPSFTADTTSGGFPLLVNFTNTSTLGNVVPTGYAWTFGDGGTSTDENPSYTYNIPGAYDVRLSITSSQGTVSTTRAGLITIAPDIDFDASTSSGAMPLAVTFTDNTGLGNLTVTERRWNFGDGTPVQNTQTATVTHTYTTPGNYTPTLTLVTPAGNFTAPMADDIAVNPVPAFTADLQSGPGALTAVFTDDTNTGSVSTSNRVWNWGDGTPNTTTNNATASHTFASPGVYDVSLTINTATQGSFTTTEVDFITVNTLTFSITGGLTGAAPHTISVANTTPVGDLPITGVQWDFGDGSGQTANASHTYANPGTFPINMVAATAQGNRTVTGTAPVVVSPVIAYSANLTSGPAILDVTFTDNTNTGGVSVTSRTWSFGDGTTVTVNAPTTTVTHRYTNTGSTTLVRDASLTLNTGIGNFQSPSPVNITIYPIVFTADKTNLVAPLLVTFTDLTSVGAVPITSWAWNFKDGGTSSTLVNAASHNYTQPGSYDVELTITTGQGNTATVSLAIPVLVKPVIRYNASTTTVGPKPLTVGVVDQTVTGNLTGISRRWTWGDGTTSTVAGTSTTHIFSSAGCFSTTMELVTNEGTFSDNKNVVKVTANESRLLTPNTTGNNGQAGIMFDLQALIDLEIDSYSLYFTSTGANCDVRQYFSLTSAQGFESNPLVWTLQDATSVVAGSPAVVDFDNLGMVTGMRLGIYLYNRTAASGGPNIRYQNGTTNVRLSISDSRLKLITDAGKAVGLTNDFNGNTFADRYFVGSVKYNYDVVCNAKSGGLERETQAATLDFGKAAGADTGAAVEEETLSAHTRDGGWIAIGYNSISGTLSPTPLLIKTDSAMSVLWEQDLAGYALDAIDGIRALDDGDILLWGPSSLGGTEGGLMLLRLDPSGNMRWEQVADGVLASDAVTLAQGPDAGSILVLYGRTDAGAGEIPVVLAIDAFSHTMWKTELPASDNRVNWGLYTDESGLTTIYGSLTEDADDSVIWTQRVNVLGELLDPSEAP